MIIFSHGLRRSCLVGVFCGMVLVLSATGAGASTVRITAVTPSHSRDMAAHVFRTPEEWQRGAGVLVDIPEDEAVVLLFPTARWFVFSAGRLPFAVDALALSADGQVLAAVRHLTGDGLRAHATPVNAIVFARSGSDVLQGMEEGHLVLARGFSLKPTDRDPADHRSMASRRARAVAQLLSGNRSDGAAPADAGAIHLAANDFAAAQRCYRRALRTGRQADWLTGLALAQAGAGDVEQALVTFSQVLDAWPDYLPAYRHLERLLRLLDKPALIVSMYREGMARRPDLPALRRELARFHLSAGQPEIARKVLDEVVETDPLSLAHTARLRADIALRTGDPEKAAAFCRQYLDAFPNAPRAGELRLFIARHGATPEMEGPP